VIRFGNVHCSVKCRRLHYQHPFTAGVAFYLRASLIRNVLFQVTIELAEASVDATHSMRLIPCSLALGTAQLPFLGRAKAQGIRNRRGCVHAYGPRGFNRSGWNGRLQGGVRDRAEQNARCDEPDTQAKQAAYVRCAWHESPLGFIGRGRGLSSLLSWGAAGRADKFAHIFARRMRRATSRFLYAIG
jgi:hypothetical protein